MHPLPSTEPAAIQAGDTLRWRRLLPQASAADGWTLSYRLINADQRIDIVALPDGNAHLVDVPAAATGAYPPGRYTWVASVSRAGERHTVSGGALQVLPDLAGAGAGIDARSPAQRALDELRAALVRWLASSGHVQEYDIAGRRMRFATADEIRKRIALAEAEVAREGAALGLRAGARRVYVRF